jgi:hypothetical protein
MFRVSPTVRIRHHIDELIAQDRPLPEILAEVARLGAQLLMQAALEAEVTEFLGRDRYARAALTEDARPGSRNGYREVAAWGITTDGKPAFIGLGPGTGESFDAGHRSPRPSREAPEGATGASTVRTRAVHKPRAGERPAAARGCRPDGPRLRRRERKAVAEYFSGVLTIQRYPNGFPTGVKVADLPPERELRIDIWSRQCAEPPGPRRV